MISFENDYNTGAHPGILARRRTWSRSPGTVQTITAKVQRIRSGRPAGARMRR